MRCRRQILGGCYSETAGNITAEDKVIIAQVADQGNVHGICQAEDDEFIQVTFPYVKESIEVLQVRKICKNLNDFIESLHDVTARASFSNDNVNVSDELKVKEDIPDQIMEKLFSPYTPVLVEQNEYHAIDIINANKTRRDVENRYVEELLEGKIKRLINAGMKAKIVLNEFDLPDLTLGVKLGSARSSGELLLSLTRLAEPMGYQVTNRKELIKKMHEVSWYAFHRTIAIECPDARKCYQLYFNAEMLVGGSEVTQPTEIERLFERMSIQHDPEKYKSELPDNVLACIESINEDTHIPVDRSQETRLHVEKKNGITTLVFEFSGTQVHRTQRVLLYECDHRCVFVSHATAAGFAKNLSVQEIIKHTWMRNRNIDLVGFVIDPSLAIVGRVVHPTDNIDWDEFIYCAYTLAVEADNLEYLLQRQDVH